MTDFIAPSEWQKVIVRHMLSVVPTAERFLSQIELMSVRVQGDASQFDIFVKDTDADQRGSSHCLSMGEYVDVDGYTVSLGLHERDGVLDLFERYKIGPDLVELEPEISKVRVWAHSPKPA